MPPDDPRAKKPRKQTKAGEAAFEASGWGEGPGNLERDLLGIWALYLSDPQTNVAAFEAMSRIAQHWWDDRVDIDRPDPNFGIQPLSAVPVPWWIVHLFGHSWRNYRDKSDKPAGEAFLLEGGGQGKRKAITQLDQRLRELRLTLEIGFRQQQTSKTKPRKSIDEIILEVSNEYGISYDTALAYWKKHRKLIKSALDRNLAKKG